MMKRRIKVLQLHPDYNIKAHDFADLGEQIFKALPDDRYETVNAFLRGFLHRCRKTERERERK